MEILLGLFGFLVLINLITVPMFGAGLFRIVFGEIFGAIFNPVLPEPERLSTYFVDDEIDEWKEDEFVGWCTMPIMDAGILGLICAEEICQQRSFHWNLKYISKLVLPEVKTEESKEEYRKNYIESFKRYGVCITSPRLEVYRKKDGTYYAWPSDIAMSMAVGKLQYEEMCDAYNHNNDDMLGSCPPSHLPHHAESLIFYYDMPWVLFDSSKGHEKGNLSFYQKVQITRGDYPMILERCKNNNHEIDYVNRCLFRREQRKDPNVQPGYGYRIVSRGQLRMYIVCSGKKDSKILGREITKDKLPGRDPETWMRRKYRSI